MIDQELQTALNVDPTPEFVARVRTRIAIEPAPARWGVSWWLPLASAAAVAVVVLAAVVWQRSTPATETVPPLAARSLGNIAVPVMPSSPESAFQNYARPLVAQAFRPASWPRSSPKGLRSVRAPTNERQTASEEILIDPREAAALRALLTGRPLQPEHTYAGSSLDRLEIPLITIAPLDTGGEGVRQ